MTTLGLAVGCADSAAVLVDNGRILGAVQEERFSRLKHDAGFPHHSITWCRSLGHPRSVAVHAPNGLPDEVVALGLPVTQVPPFLAHAASAFLPSPFEEAAVLVLGLSGEGVAAWGGQGEGGHLSTVFDSRQSLGDFYAGVTKFLGFRPGSGELKVMGLAPYGQPRHQQALADLVDCPPEHLLARLPEALGVPARVPESMLDSVYADIAASLQRVLEEAVLEQARRLAGLSDRLCLGGGLALNCAANRRIADAGLFRDLWVQPASGNAGAALGAALLVEGGRQPNDAMRAALLGPELGHVAAELQSCGASFIELPTDELVARVAGELAEGRIVGWVRGPMEFGPRALGARSILADPRQVGMQRLLNDAVKYREPFRPFAPAVVAERADEWFALAGPSPYMLLTAEVRSDKRALIPAVTHVDGSARVQTVDAADNADFHALLTRFGRLTGCPVLVNTSFNVRGEPIVGSAADAFRCFMGGDIDSLVVGDCLLRKEDQNPALRRKNDRDFLPD